MFLNIEDEKYVVFKVDEFEKFLDKSNSLIDSGWAYDNGDLSKWVDEILVADAVVIRRQDMFSPPAFDAYANSIMATVETLKVAQSTDKATIDRLNNIAAYFHAQADRAWDTNRKIPD